MEFIRSADGTRIGYVRRGQGPALLLVHGTAADHKRWLPLLPMLERQFTLYALDRRGYGESGDTAPYAIEREAEDIAALIDAVEEDPVFLLGHSYGAICALTAAPRAPRLGGLVLFEPPIPASPGAYFSQAQVERLRGLVARDALEAACESFYRDIALAPPHKLALLKTSPIWPLLVRSAGCILRELDYAGKGRLEPEKFRGWRIPTLLLLGGDSEPRYWATMEQANAVLPGSRIAILEGQGHDAMTADPAAFAQALLPFLADCAASAKSDEEMRRRA